MSQKTQTPINSTCQADAGINSNKDDETRELTENLSKIKNKIVVLSGKGGVGKSTVSTNLAVSLAQKGYKTGILDIDIHGPSIPKMLGIEGAPLITNRNNKLIPVNFHNSLKVMSIGLMLSDENQAIIWRGPLKYGVIKQFLKDVEWGELDFLIIDSPPGTGDEPLSLCQLIDNVTGTVIVTTPQDVALLDVKKSITFCKSLNMPIFGIVENMSGFTCPDCGKTHNIFKNGGGEKMASEMGIPFLGNIPIEIEIAERGDSGKPLVESKDITGAVKAFSIIVEKISSHKGVKSS